VVAIVPDEFRALVINSVDEFFDEDIYEQKLAEYSEDDITDMVKKAARGLYRRQLSGGNYFPSNIKIKYLFFIFL
jgi:hypothetical protein